MSSCVEACSDPSVGETVDFIFQAPPVMSTGFAVKMNCLKPLEDGGRGGTWHVVSVCLCVMIILYVHCDTVV